MLTDEKILEVVGYVIDERKRDKIASMNALLNRAVRRARISFSDQPEAKRRAGEELADHADVAQSIPERAYRR